RAKVLALMSGLKERAKTLVELADNAAFLGRSLPLSFDAKAEKQFTPENRAMLGRLAEALKAAEPFTRETVDATLRQFAETHEMKLGKVAQPLRAAVTGSTMSPGIDDTLVALGRDEVLARINAVAAHE
ncbi:MAG: glutamate--tRNA ligase, partial [Komagataeibacter saccharivorans]